MVMSSHVFEKPADVILDQCACLIWFSILNSCENVTQISVIFL